MRMPGIGPITALAIVAAIGDGHRFWTGRDLAACLGLIPLDKSSGGKEQLGKITEKGDRYVRKLLVVSMTSRAVIARRSPEKEDLWTAKIITDKPFRSATTAMANKQSSQDHPGDAHKETGTPAACVLIAPAAREMQDVEVMMRN